MNNHFALEKSKYKQLTNENTHTRSFLCLTIGDVTMDRHSKIRLQRVDQSTIRSLKRRKFNDDLFISTILTHKHPKSNKENHTLLSINIDYSI